MAAGRSTPGTCEEVAEDRTLHAIAVTIAAEQLANEAATPRRRIEIFGDHTCHVGRAFFRISLDPLPNRGARNVSHRTRIASVKTIIPTQPTRNDKAASVHRRL